MADMREPKRQRLAGGPRSPGWNEDRERSRHDRERQESLRETNHPRESDHERVNLPPINASFDFSTYRQGLPQSPPYPRSGNGYADVGQRPTSNPKHDSRQFPTASHQYMPPPPSGPQSEHGTSVKRETEPASNRWPGVNKTQPFPSHSPMTAKNGNQPSPQSYTSPPSYETSNGNTSGTQSYVTPAVGLPSPMATNPSRQNFDPIVTPSADGILFNIPNCFAIPTATTGKKKAQRASQACDSCRSLKAKCDEAKPCQSCLEKNISCTYRQPEPKAQDKLQSQMSSNIESILEIVTEMSAKINNLEAQVKCLEESRGSPTDSKPLTQDPNNIKTSSSPPERKVSHESEASMTLMVKPADPETREADSSDEETADPLNPSKPKFGIQHTTNACELLKLPAIAYLVEDEVQRGRVGKGKGARIDRYLWRYEKRRGPLRQHGYGEGSKVFDSTSSHISSMEASSPGSFCDEPYGPIAVKLVPSKFEYSVRKYEGVFHDDPVGGLGIDGNLDLREGEVRRLIQIYMDRMNRLHPILEKKEVDRLVKQFLSETDQTRDKSFVNPRPFIPDRKLGGETHSQPGSTPDPANPQIFRRVPQRSPGNAVVLMMLGLGKICEYKGKKLPEVAWGRENMNESEVAYVRGSTTRSSSPSSPRSSAQASPQAQQSTPGHTPLGADQLPLLKPWERRGSLKNNAVFPGLAYVAFATDIIGNELSGSTMSHIQANILAGLYFGQLVRPIQSMAYLHVASRAIQEKIRLKSSLSNLPPGRKWCYPKDNPLVYAFWTCLQLECDIVAELPCPHSGILGYEELMPYPNTSYSMDEEGMPEDVAHHYDAQLWLRKHLNDIHAEYNPADPQATSLFKKDRETFKSIEAVEETRLFQFENAPWKKTIMRNWIIDPTEDKPPACATDILDARTRAKFYGARVITYRPFVQVILKFSWDLQHDSSDGSLPNAAKLDLNSLPGIVWHWEAGYPKKYDGPADKPMEYKVTKTYGSDHWKYFEKGIRALINSTTAFHGMESPDSPRLIVTNVFGTAHAQWGNVITLLACYHDRELSHVLWKYLDRHDFRALVLKTIRFMEHHSHRWSGTRTSVNILRAAVFRTGILREAEVDESTPGSTAGARPAHDPSPPKPPGTPQMSPPAVPAARHAAPHFPMVL